jgi:hypothetical protein
MDYAKLISLAGTLGTVLAKQQEGKAQGKVAQANVNQNQDRNATSLFATQQNAQNQAGQLDLERKQFENTNRAAQAKQAMIGALLGHGMTPTSISGGHASGGLMASLNANPEALLAMRTMGSQGAQAQNTPVQFQGGQMVKPPSLTPTPEVDKGGWLASLASLAQLAGAASPYIKQYGGSSGGGGDIS